MSLRTNARYGFGLVFARFLPLNDDLTIPAITRIIGGVGPFDFSGVTDSSNVDLKVKIDDADAESLTVDISGASSDSAVTVTEVVAALNTAFTGAAIELEASEDSTTNRVKIESTNTASPPDTVQIYDEFAELILLGQGFGVKYVKSDTMVSVGETPTMKEEEQFTTTDAKGLDTEVLSDGYRKGFTASIVDSAEDWELRALIEGGYYDETNGEYEVPTSDDEKLYFSVEAYYAQYIRGTNKEADEAGYVKKYYRSCKGAAGDISHERAFANQTYNITGTTYKDEDGTLHGDTELTKLTPSEYEALNLYNV